MKKINVGIIGMGFIGESHIEAVKRIGICNVVAVADINYQLAQEKAEFYGIEKVYKTMDELLNDKSIDAIHNCTPNFLHKEINKKIIASGKHLLSEKPLTTTYEEAKQLLDLKEKHPEVEVCVNFNYRLNPVVLEMKERIKRNELGDVRIISGQFTQDWLMYDTDYSWRLDTEISGKSCCLADIGSHWMDIVQHVTGHKIISVLGDLVTVIPTRKKPKNQQETFKDSVDCEYEEVKITNDDYAAVLFKTNKGATGVFHVTALAPGHGCSLEFEINGSKQSFGWNQEENDKMWIGRRGGDNGIVIRNPNTLSENIRPYTKLAFGHPEGWNDAFKSNIYAFYKYIADGRIGKKLFSTLEDGAYIVKLTEAIMESSKNKQWVNL